MRTFTIFTLAFLASSNVVSAQEVGSGIHLIPRIGSHVVDNRDIVRVDEQWAGADGSAVLGVGLELDLPVRWLALRMTADRTIGSSLVADEQVGNESCGQSCQRAVTREREVAGFSMWTLGADLLLRLSSAEWRMRPFLVAGTGMKHYRFDKDEVRSEDRFAAGLDDGYDAEHHVGLGFDVEAYGSVLRFEATDYMSEREVGFLMPSLAPGGEPRFVHGESPQHDLQLTVGWRIPIR